jgi:hypothetical protein
MPTFPFPATYQHTKFVTASLAPPKTVSRVRHRLGTATMPDKSRLPRKNMSPLAAVSGLVFVTCPFRALLVDI